MLTQSLSPSSGFSAKSRCRNNHGSRDLGKRALDIAGASLLTLALLPVLLLLLGMLRATQPSAIYRHKRVGLRGRTFDCLKLRTMHMDGDRILAELLEADPEAQREWATNRKLKNDPRITPIGRFLRKTSLDELPQLLNVLRGEMSLVGPRPVVARELDEHYGPEGTDLYCSVRPGLTGLWQVSGRSDTSYRQRVELDARYVRERSLGLDVKILLRTPVAVLRRDGAC
ncbi:sugar transferase [Plastoroseomonas arctica]|uniref:Sugar transferase n=1 Tax=Plastoroseomonas arctica TaxID=1509237 RepID=A0AAF1K7L4_9PROT|nr:sugar transferase [Plastoroseomonas arctica]MBR0657126.1 sugar transferase [Plastoroseomonas arctica]